MGWNRVEISGLGGQPDGLPVNGTVSTNGFGSPLETSPGYRGFVFPDIRGCRFRATELTVGCGVEVGLELVDRALSSGSKKDLPVLEAGLADLELASDPGKVIG